MPKLFIRIRTYAYTTCAAENRRYCSEAEGAGEKSWILLDFENRKLERAAVHRDGKRVAYLRRVTTIFHIYVRTSTRMRILRVRVVIGKRGRCEIRRKYTYYMHLYRFLPTWTVRFNLGYL